MIEREFTVRLGSTIEHKDGNVTLVLYVVDDNQVMSKLTLKRAETVSQLVDEKFPMPQELPCA